MAVRFLSENLIVFPLLSNILSLTFRGTCIVIYSYNKIVNKMHYSHIYLLKISTYYGQMYCPSSVVLIPYSQQITNTNCCEYSIKTPDDGQ